MQRRPAEIGLGGSLFLAAGLAIWPPGNVYWNVVADRAGVLVTVGIAVALCGVVGAGVALLTGVSLVNVSIGGGVTYATGVVLLDRVVPPFDVAGYSFVYALLLLGFLSGVIVVTGFRGRAPAALSAFAG